MNILPKNPDYGNQNIADCTTNSPRLYALFDHASIAGSPQISDNSGKSDRQRVSVRSFNKKLALDIQKKLNAKKPDITAAFVLRTLDTWKKNFWSLYEMGNHTGLTVFQAQLLENAEMNLLQKKLFKITSQPVTDYFAGSYSVEHIEESIDVITGT